jgi:integrase/recombinase XerD
MRLCQNYGKGNKERFVPIGKAAQKYIHIYRESMRVHLNIKKEFGILVLNRRGANSRALHFYHYKNLAVKTEMNNIHMFRIFATHLLKTVLICVHSTDAWVMNR